MSKADSPKVQLAINGTAYEGWTAARVTRGIECLSGAFELGVSDRWAGQSEPWPIRQGDKCELKFGDTPMITGYVDRRSISISGEEHTFRVSGRDRAGLMVDCSAGAPTLSDEVRAALGVPATALEILGPWEFRNLSFVALAEKLTIPFDIKVKSDVPAVDLPRPFAKFSVDPGEKAFDVLDRACRVAGVLPVSDGLGGIRLTRPGFGGIASPLVEGQNILSASADFDSTLRFARYVVLGQGPGADRNFGSSASAVRGEARDPEVQRSARSLIIRAEQSLTREQARARAEWEAKVRAGRAATVSVTVPGWTQPDGALWPVNAFVDLRCPSVQIEGQMLITQAVYSLDDGGTKTELALRRPDAFVPEPIVQPKPAPAGAKPKPWEEIRNGA